MIRIIIREIAILTLCISIFPVVFLSLFFHGDISEYSLVLIYRELFNAGTSNLGSALTLLVRILVPYLSVQAIRAYQWSKTNINAKRWANLYFAILSASLGIWCASISLDLFYFMFELGDIPGEIRQFFRMEYAHLFGALAGFYICFRCLRLFFLPNEPIRKGKPKVNQICH